MEFEINGSIWEIEEIADYEMRVKAENDCTLGLTVYTEQKVYITKEQKNKEKTLRHELEHVWLFENGHNAHERSFTHEDVCEIVASSWKFIEETIKEYAELKNIRNNKAKEKE